MDLISREELIEAILDARRDETDTIPKLIRFIRKQPSVKQKYEGLSVFEESVQADRAVCVYVPTEPKTGRWINVNGVLKCSACGELDNRMYRTDSYCPNCGAKMEVDE